MAYACCFPQPSRRTLSASPVLYVVSPLLCHNAKEVIMLNDGRSATSIKLNRVEIRSYPDSSLVELKASNRI